VKAEEVAEVELSPAKAAALEDSKSLRRRRKDRRPIPTSTPNPTTFRFEIFAIERFGDWVIESRGRFPAARKPVAPLLTQYRSCVGSAKLNSIAKSRNRQIAKIQ
jgi:hypothetical protein